MKDIHAFIEDICELENIFFQFFFDRKLEEFVNSRIENEIEFSRLIGESKGLKGREREFEDIFSPITDKGKGVSAEALIAKLESIMLATDRVGRLAVIRRISRELNRALCIGVWGVDMMCGVDCWDDGGIFGAIYWDVIEEGDDGKYIIPDNLKRTHDIIGFTESAMFDLCYFCRELKTLSEDFDIKFKDEIEKLGFGKLNDITAIEWGNRLMPTQKKEPKQLIYRDIFRSPWQNHLPQFEKAMSAHGYIIGKQWIGENGKKSELAELYYYLKMENIIAQGEEARQLNALYSEFGLSVGKDNTKNGEYCTLRALRKADGDSDTKERFENILKSWVDQRFTI